MNVEIIAWILLVLGLGLGLASIIWTILPGPLFVFLGAAAFKWLAPLYFSWIVVAVVGAIAIASWIADFFSGVAGARLGGSTKHGIVGATVGGIAGMGLGLPGLILGPFVGALLGDLYGKRRDLMALLRSGAGAALASLLAIVLKVVLLLVQAVVVLLALVF